jgi:hypothetical protein
MVAKYIDMIVDAIHTLRERKGSSAAGIWKYLQTKYPAGVRAGQAGFKVYRVQLRRAVLGG